MFGLFSCKNDLDVSSIVPEDEPYVYSDSLLDEYQKDYNEQYIILKDLQRETQNKFDSLIQQIDVQLTLEENLLRIDFLEKVKENALIIRERSKQLNNFLVAETSFMIEYSGDKNFGISENGNKYEHHYKVDHSGFFDLLELNHLKNKGDYKTPLYLYVGDKGFEAPRGLWLLDTINQFKEDAYMTVISVTDTIVMPIFDFMDSQILVLESLDKNAITVFNTKLDDLFIDYPDPEKKYLVNVFKYLTQPQRTERNGEAWPWIAAQFDTPLIEAAKTFLLFQRMIYSAENITYDYLLQKLESN